MWIAGVNYGVLHQTAQLKNRVLELQRPEDLQHVVAIEQVEGTALHWPRQGPCDPS